MDQVQDLTLLSIDPRISHYPLPGKRLYSHLLDRFRRPTRHRRDSTLEPRLSADAVGLAGKPAKSRHRHRYDDFDNVGRRHRRPLQPVVNDIQAMRAKGMKLKRIAGELTERGVSTKTGKKHHWSHQEVARILSR